jgi:hypothetical protein
MQYRYRYVLSKALCYTLCGSGSATLTQTYSSVLSYSHLCPGRYRYTENFFTAGIWKDKLLMKNSGTGTDIYL